MKNWIKHTLLGVAASAALLGAAAYAQGAFPDGAPSVADSAAHQARMLEHIAKRLNLTAAQQAKLQTLATTLHTQHQAMLSAAGGDPHAQAQALIAGNTFDRAGAQLLVNQKIQQVQAGAPAIIAATGDFFDSLTPAQQQQVRDFAASHHGGGHWHHGHAASAASSN